MSHKGEAIGFSLGPGPLASLHPCCRVVVERNPKGLQLGYCRPARQIPSYSRQGRVMWQYDRYEYRRSRLHSQVVLALTKGAALYSTISDFLGMPPSEVLGVHMAGIERGLSCFVIVVVIFLSSLSLCRSY